MRVAAIAVLTLLCGCSSTPTVEDINASRAKWSAACEAKGYKSGSQDFYTCMNLAATEEGMRPLQAAQATTGALTAATIGLAVLSDARVKTSIQQIALLNNGISLYRFRYLGSDQTYVGVIAQEVRRIRPDAVVTGNDGLLRVRYDLVGAPFVTWQDWSGRNAARSSRLEN